MSIFGSFLTVDRSGLTQAQIELRMEILNLEREIEARMGMTLDRYDPAMVAQSYRVAALSGIVRESLS